MIACCHFRPDSGVWQSVNQIFTECTSRLCGPDVDDVSKVSTLGSAKVFTKGIIDSTDGSIPRFPRLDQCAHFHYEFVELPPIQIVLVSEELKPLSQAPVSEDIENRALLVQVTSLGRSWVVRRTYENFRFLDKQLHKCCYDRKISQLSELPPEQNSNQDIQTCVESLLEKYLARLTEIAGSLITCGPVLGWLELDNRGHRLIVTDDSDINTPAVAAAYVVKRYTAQASDEISFEVGDMISVIDMPPPEESIWWRGKRGFQVGFFPCECVQVIEGKVPQGIHAQSLTLPSSRPPLAPIRSPSQEPMKPVLRKHGKLIAFFRSFILSRPPRPWLKRSGILRERVFGCDLAEHLLNSGHSIPMVLKCCAEFVESHGIVDGIYRLSGVTSNIQKLRNSFDEEKIPGLYEDDSILQDIHCVSSVLKMYFRELPNPLLTYQLYDKFASAVTHEDDIRLLHVRDVVQQLPPPHYRTLEYLMRHLSRIASFSSTTGMTPKNIAIVWAPNLLRSKQLERGGVSALQDVGTQAVVTEYMVRYVDLIFNDKIPNFSPSNQTRNTPPRPKSLALTTPVKLISIDEARKKSLAAIKTDQNYIDVGGGPDKLPKTYHTVIDLPSRKGGSLKHKKSPIHWKTFFWKRQHSSKKSPTREKLNLSDIVTSVDADRQPMKRLRPTQSVESLNSAQKSAKNEVEDKIKSTPVMSSESSTSSCTPVSSPMTHNRSVSHDSYFKYERKRSLSLSYPVKEESSNDVSPQLEFEELNMEFALSENDIRVFSEDETLRSDTASKATYSSQKSFKRNLLRSSSENSRNFLRIKRDKAFKSCNLNECRVDDEVFNKTPSRESLESALIEPELLERLTQLRPLPSASSESEDRSPETKSFKSDLKKKDKIESTSTYFLTHSLEESRNVSPETPQHNDVLYHPLSDATELSTPSESHAETIPSALQTLSPDSLPEYEHFSGSTCCDIVIKQTPETPVASEIEYEALCESSNANTPKSLSDEPEYANVIYDNGGNESDHAYENWDFTRETDSLSTSQIDNSLYQQVKYLRQSVQEVNEMVDKDQKREKRKSITKLTIHLSKLESVGSDSPTPSESSVPLCKCPSQPESPLCFSVSSCAAELPIMHSYSDSAIPPTKTDLDDISFSKSTIIPQTAFNTHTSTKSRSDCVSSINENSPTSLDTIEIKQNEKVRPVPLPRKFSLDDTMHKEKIQVMDKSSELHSVDYTGSKQHTRNPSLLPSSDDTVMILPSEIPLNDDHISLRLSPLNVSGFSELEPIEEIISTAEFTENNNSVSPTSDTISTSFSEEICNDTGLELNRYSNNVNVPDSKVEIRTTEALPIPIETVLIDSNSSSVKVETNRELSPSITPNDDSTDVDVSSLPIFQKNNESLLEQPSSLPTLAANSSQLSEKTDEDSLKRERIEKYKEERRSFLRKNYHPNSFKGEKDEMILRLKSKATSPSRFDKVLDIDAIEQVDDNDLSFISCYDIKDEETPVVGKVPLIISDTNKKYFIGNEQKIVDEKDGYLAKKPLCHSLSDPKTIVSNVYREKKKLTQVKSHPKDIYSKAENKVKNPLQPDFIQNFPKPDSKCHTDFRERDKPIDHMKQDRETSTLISNKIASLENKYNEIPCKTNRVKEDEVRVKDRVAIFQQSVSPNQTDLKVEKTIPLRKPSTSREKKYRAKSESSDVPYRLPVASRRSSDARVLPISRKCSGPSLETIGHDKIRAIAAQFERESIVGSGSKAYLRQLSK